MTRTQKAIWLILACALCAIASCRGEVISDRLLDAIAQIESSGRANAIGDDGKASGMFQLHRAAWEDALKVCPVMGAYEIAAHDPVKSRQAARIYLTLLFQSLQKAGHPQPAPELVYLCYNRGFTGAASISFDIKRAPKHTQRACAKLKGMMK
jgi:hypothetical protein